MDNGQIEQAWAALQKAKRYIVGVQLFLPFEQLQLFSGQLDKAVGEIIKAQAIIMSEAK